MGGYPNIQFVPVDFRGVNPHLRRFLAQMQHVTHASNICVDTFMGNDTLVLWRNRIAEWFLKSCQQDYLCCFDDDAVPVEETLKMLDSAADVVGCHFFAKTGDVGHETDGTFSMAAYKVSRNALEKIEVPRYRFVYNEQHTKSMLCECLWFCQQARKAGFFPVKAGVIAHRMSVAVIPSSDTEDSCKMKFLHQLKDVHLPHAEE